MTLKSLIQRLLDSRTTPEEAAHSAMPKPETPTIVSNLVTDNTWHSLIAPFDGYFSCKGITKHLLIENSAAQWSGVTGLTSGGYMGFTLPMSKGSEVRYQLDHNSTGVMITFSKTIGGGYQALKNVLLQGGVLCRLKHLYSSLRRSSWLARRSGWLISRLIFLRPLQKLPSLLTENATPSQCLTRASWFCNVTASCLQDLTDLTWSISEREQTATSAFLFIPRKATLFLTRLANPTTSEPQTCTSIRLTVANNLSIGGVSC